jgi:hypothetical protein
MAGRKIWNDDLIAGLQSRRQNRFDQNKRSHFQFERAVGVVRGHRGDVTKPEQLAKYIGPNKLTQTVLGVITKIMNEEEPVIEPVGSGGCSTRQNNKRYVPTARSGIWAVLLTLYEQHQRGVQVMNKDQIIDLAQTKCDADMHIPDPQSGRSAWNSKDTLVKHQLIRWNRLSRDFRGQGGFGKAKDEYSITERGINLVKEVILLNNPTALSTNGGRSGGGGSGCSGGASHIRCECGLPAKMNTRPGHHNNFYNCPLLTTRGGCKYYRKCSVMQKFIGKGSISTGGKPKANVEQEDDETLLRFLESDNTAVSFKTMSKARRERVHKRCAQLARDLNKTERDFLQHESRGVSSQRTLRVTKVQAGRLHGADLQRARELLGVGGSGAGRSGGCSGAGEGRTLGGTPHK